MEKKGEFSPEELGKKYGIALGELEKEQIKLAKTLELKDKIDFKLIEKIGAVDNSYFKNNIVSVALIFSPDQEISGQEYFSERVRFPYIRGFRAYRELPAMVEAFNKLEEKPDVVFIRGNGIAHPRLGIASHFSLSTGVPAIGIADSLMEEAKVEGEDVILSGKKVGKVLLSKEKSNPLYVSPGNFIGTHSCSSSIFICTF